MKVDVADCVGEEVAFDSLIRGGLSVAPKRARVIDIQSTEDVDNIVEEVLNDDGLFGDEEGLFTDADLSDDSLYKGAEAATADLASNGISLTAIEQNSTFTDSCSDVEIVEQANMVIESIKIMGPAAFVAEQVRLGAFPLHLLEKIGFQMPESVRATNESSQWTYVKRFLLRYVYQRQRLLQYSSLEDAVELIRTSRRILLLTGAGISVSCGIPDFRSENGLYAKIQREYALPEPECMFDIEFFRIDPEPFYSFAKELFPGHFKPSFAHYFIKLLEHRSALLRDYTQNIDTLEAVAGIQRVVYCHGSFATASCMECKKKVMFEEFKQMMEAESVPTCSKCSDVMKPDVVFFGEPLPAAFEDHLEHDIGSTDLVIVMGSSLKVQPVDSIPDLIPPHVPQILINRERVNHNFDIELLGDCDVILAEIVRRLAWSFDNVIDEPAPSIGFLEPNIYIFPGAKIRGSVFKGHESEEEPNDFQEESDYSQDDSQGLGDSLAECINIIGDNHYSDADSYPAKPPRGKY